MATYCIQCGARLEPGARFCHVCGAAVGAPEPAAVTVQLLPTTPAPPPSPAVAESWPDWQATGQPVAIGNHATFGERFVAVIIDWVILAVFWTVSATVLSVVAYALGGSSNETDAAIGAVVFLLTIFAHWFYFAGLESSDWQATVGKRAMKIVVTDEHGRRLSFARATGRSFARILSGMFFFVGYLLAAVTRQQQALHDLLAGTLVLKR